MESNIVANAAPGEGSGGEATLHGPLYPPADWPALSLAMLECANVGISK